MARRISDSDPLELLERLAVLTPRPRVNLILSRGRGWRRRCLPSKSMAIVTRNAGIIRLLIWARARATLRRSGGRLSGFFSVAM